MSRELLRELDLVVTRLAGPASMGRDRRLYAILDERQGALVQLTARQARQVVDVLREDLVGDEAAKIRRDLMIAASGATRELAELYLTAARISIELSNIGARAEQLDETTRRNLALLLRVVVHQLEQ